MTGSILNPRAVKWFSQRFFDIFILLNKTRYNANP